MSTTTPNMSLVVPTVGSDFSPNYALEINQSLTTIDQHNHTAGNGVQINPSGININSALNFQSNQAQNVSGLNLIAQGSAPQNNTVYESGNDLHWVNGAGLDIQITNGSGVAGSPGSIANLTSPASASYVSLNETFVWQSDANIAANMDFGSAIFRNLSPNSTFGVTVSAPAALGSNYSLALPILPSSQKIMTLDNLGNLAAPYVIDGSTLNITSNVIQVAPMGITSAQIANNTIATSQIAAQGILAANIANNTLTTTQISNSAGITPTQLAASSTASVSASNAIITATTYQTTALSVTVACVSGRPVILNFSGSNFSTTPTTNQHILVTNGSAVAKISASGTIVSGDILFETNGSSTAYSPTLLNQTVIAPATGNITFTVLAAAIAGSVGITFSNIRMTAIAL